MSDIKWLEKSIKLGDLKDYEHNPRTITKKEFEKLVNSIKQDGYHARIMVDTDNTIIGGHSRKKALLTAGFKAEDNIKVIYPSRQLDVHEFQRLNIRDNLSYGAFDFDVLANHFDSAQLLEWGVPDEMIMPFESDPKELEELKEESKCETCGRII